MVGKNYWDENLGPFYTERSLAKWLGITVDEVLAMAEARTILAVSFEDGDEGLAFPSRQFDEHKRPPPRLDEAVRAIDPHNELPWETALWVFLGTVGNGRTPLSMLREGEADELILEARRTRESVWGP